MAKAAQEVEVKKDAGLPAHLQGGKTTKIGNVDSSDLIIPRVKLLQAISPEIDAFDNSKKGEFWHTIGEQSLGAKIRGIPLLMVKSFVLWAPRGDDRGILARSNDGVHWDQNAGMTFEVKPKGSPHNVKYTLGRTVHDRVDGYPALSEFGSSIPGDPKSPPAAALTYRFLWYFPDYPEMSPAVIINTRSSVKPAQGLLTKIEQRPVDHYAQVYQVGVFKDGTDQEPFYNYTYTADGYASEDEYNLTKALYEKYNTAEWQASDESQDPDREGGGGRRSGGPSDSDKF